jgi:uncharacterized coiled-coil protein SlyX
MKNELTARVERLEKICGLQQQLLDRLAIAARGQQAVIEALARHAGVDLQAQPAQAAPLGRMN